jgi:hypothetical protein
LLDEDGAGGNTIQRAPEGAAATEGGAHGDDRVARAHYCAGGDAHPCSGAEKVVVFA